MYRAFYNLKGLPFENKIKTSDLYLSKDMKELLSRLNYLKEIRGLMLITGDSGVGKTSVMRYFVENLREDSYKPVYIKLASVSVNDFYKQLDFLLSGEYHHRKDQTFYSIQNTIINLSASQNKIPVIILEEAHYLSLKNLLELHMLLNFEFDSKNPAIFILNGDASLKTRIIKPILTPLNQRIRIKFHLNSLPEPETKEYIEHRLKLVGSKENLLTEAAYSAAHSITNGGMRMINNLLDKSLLIGFSKKTQIIDEEIIYLASKEL